MVVYRRFTLIALPFIVLLGFQPLPTLIAQRQDHRSSVETELKDTDAVDVGEVISRGPDSVTVKNDRFTRVFRINGQTIIRRVDSTPLQVGDMVDVRCHVDGSGTAIADLIEANIAHWEGVITKVAEYTVYIRFDSPVEGSSKVIFDRNTEFRYCAGDDLKRACTLADLKVGRHLDTIGFILKPSELRATRVLGIQDH
jgi:hypothetical protein